MVVISARMRDGDDSSRFPHIVGPSRDLGIVEPFIDSQSENVVAAKTSLVAGNHQAILNAAAGIDEVRVLLRFETFKVIGNQHCMEAARTRDICEFLWTEFAIRREG